MLQIYFQEDNGKSPLKIYANGVDCNYLEKFEVNFEDKLIDFSVTLTDNIFQFSSFPLGLELKASNFDGNYVSYELQQAFIRIPAEHQIYRDNQLEQETKLQYGESNLELQLIFQVPVDQQSQIDSDVYYASVSLIFTDKQSDYFPDGESILRPFFPYREEPIAANEYQMIEANLKHIFEPLTERFTKWYHYVGQATFDNCQKPSYWYINDQVFKVPRKLIDRYRYSWVDGTEITGQTVPIQEPENDVEMLQICWTTYEGTILRSNYCLWMWMLVIFIWWICLIGTENDTVSCYQEEMRCNPMTMIPFLSVRKVNSEDFFTKTSRYIIWITQHGWHMLILSAIYGKFYQDRMYDVEDAIILWYPLVALVTGWPVGYLIGYPMYYVRECVKHKYILLLHWKQVPEKGSLEAKRIKKGVEDEEDLIYTLYFLFYFFIFFIFCAEVGYSIFFNTYMTETQQAYWVASVFILLFLDLVFEFIVALIPNSYKWTKYRGYFYDFELGETFKKYEEY